MSSCIRFFNTLCQNAQQTTKNQIQRHQNKAQRSTQLCWRKNDRSTKDERHLYIQQKHTETNSLHRREKTVLTIFQLAFFHFVPLVFFQGGYHVIASPLSHHIRFFVFLFPLSYPIQRMGDYRYSAT